MKVLVSLYILTLWNKVANVSNIILIFFIPPTLNILKERNFEIERKLES